MSRNYKQLSNPFSTGGGGGHFEAHVQASFVVLMLTGGYAPCFPGCPIVEIKLQGKIDGFDTDDLIVFVESSEFKERRKLLGQIKRSVPITKCNAVFSQVIQAAWNDFNNPLVFTKSKDIIVLITESLSTTDFHNVQWLLNQARHTKEADEFYRNVEQANFSPSKSRDKLAAIQICLKKANNNSDVSKDELYSFLNHFHLLGYDLGNEVGVVLSLLHSHISQFNQQIPHLLWSRVVDIVQTWNQDGGTITLEKLPEDLQNAFKQPAITYFPKKLIETHTEPELIKLDWNQNQYVTDLVLASLVGSWDEKKEADTLVLAKLTSQNYSTWVLKAREILNFSESPFTFSNGVWKVIQRDNLWDTLGDHIFDQDLDTFGEIAVAVLTERDPCFELPVENRYAASIYGKVLTYSSVLRMGLADGLAMLGSKPNALINCSLGKPEFTAVLAIQKIFADADWVLWGSLSQLLPLLAEAAPDQFLTAVDKALHSSPCPFDELFSQEGNGITGNNYLLGLLWALESLAWEEKYLVRVCVALGELSIHDPSESWGNRPADSLLNILLPWRPQTMAPFKKRQVAIQILVKECPEAAWKLIINLLPNQKQTSTSSYKPLRRTTIPEEATKGVTRQDYWTQVLFYAELAISMAGQDPAKLVELVEHFDKLPEILLKKLLEVLSSDAIGNYPEDRRLQLWERLTKFISKHRRFSNAKWALDKELLSPIEVVAQKLAPSQPYYLYQHLFSDRDFDLYEQNGNWDEQRQKLDERRQKAVEEILNLDGIEVVIQFADAVKSPEQVGHALGQVADAIIDTVLLPKYLESKNRKFVLFVSGYVWSRYYTNSWSWVDALDKATWSCGEIGTFLSYLPFTNETWRRAEKWLGDGQCDYWLKANANPYQADDNLSTAIDKLIENGRPYAAINCLYKMSSDKQPINVSQCLKALCTALSSSEPFYSTDEHNIVELIKTLQETPNVTPDELIWVEWTYLSLLDREHEATAKVLENRLSNDPEFFCEVIRLMYHSKQTDVATKDLSKEAIARATNAWSLLHKWHIPPGVQEDGNFNAEHFSIWLQQVKEICAKSGHLEVALSHVGKILIHCPPDINGFWINHTVANALNARDVEDMRGGFRTGILNSRGIYSVDPTGKPEKELAEQYHQKAENTENAGYQRFAVTLRQVSKFYEDAANRITRKYKRDDKNCE